MPTATDYLKVIVITIVFFTMYTQHTISVASANMKNQWPLYRCNPLFMPFADNVEENFYSCMQTSMKNFIPYFLDPLHTLIQQLSTIADSHTTSMNSMRISQSNVRSLFANNFSGIINAFEMIGVEFLKNILNIKDLVAKVVGIAMTLVYIVESGLDTMESTWNGPPGQILQGLGKDFCFHPNTVVRLRNGQQAYIKDIKRSSILSDGGVVLKVLKFHNVFKLPFYDLQGIKVTGNHKVAFNNRFIYVKDHEDAWLDTELTSEWLICLITSSNHIVISPYTFCDWNDDNV